MMHRRVTQMVIYGILIAIAVTIGVWQFGRLRTDFRIDSCLDLGGAWDYDAHACKTDP